MFHGIHLACSGHMGFGVSARQVILPLSEMLQLHHEPIDYILFESHRLVWLR
jgi:hypothetical protein